MVDSKSVSDDTFVEVVASNEDVDIDASTAEELWKVWTDRYTNGGDDEMLVVIPRWFSMQEFNKKRPFVFAEVEVDNEGSGAVLFSKARFVDPSVLENGVWDQVTMTQAIEVLDISEDDDYIDESGKVWIPRSLMTVYERGGQTELNEDRITGYDQSSPNSGASDLTDMSGVED